MSILRIPFISADHSKEIRNIIRQSDLSILPIFTSGSKLNDLLTRSAFKPLPCKIKSCINKNSNCRKQNVIYQLNCSLCNESYVGETRRDLHTRLREHQRSIVQGDEKKSALATHYALHHSQTIVPKIPFTGKIIERARDNADRSIREAIWIRKKAPRINRDKGWASLATDWRN